MSSTENQKGNKGPITLKIKFKSGSLEQFIERYSVDVVVAASLSGPRSLWQSGQR